MRNEKRPGGGLPHILLCFCPLLLVLAALYLIFGDDRQINLFFRAYRPEHPDLTFWVRLFTVWGNSCFYVLYGIIFLAGWRRADRKLLGLALAYALAQIAVSVFLLRILKIGIGRPRPQVDGPWRPLAAFNPSYQSMPSGHATEIIISCLPLAGCLKKYWFSACMGLLIAAMGFSRVYIDMHYASDVLAGAFTGLFGAWAVRRLHKNRRFQAATDRLCRWSEAKRP